MKIWLDDERPMPEGYDQHCRSAESVIKAIKSGVVNEISFDHDLGEYALTGYDVAKFIEKETLAGRLNYIRCRIHTQNPVGRKNICAALQSIARYWMRNEKPKDQTLRNW